MSNFCRRDVNNNYLTYPNAYGNIAGPTRDSSSGGRGASGGSGGSGGNKMSGNTSSSFASRQMSVGGSSNTMRSQDQNRNDRRN